MIYRAGALPRMAGLAGDVVTADGMKMNLLDMVKAGPAMRGKGTAR